jgi:hypothetical protein|tara:strand:+ start:394 stop:609 length:216 start_codon:yes stop_codon:yes gene_type:complete
MKIKYLCESGINWQFYYPINQNGITEEKTSFRLHYSRDKSAIKKLANSSAYFPYGRHNIYYQDYDKQYRKS